MVTVMEASLQLFVCYDLAVHRGWLKDQQQHKCPTDSLFLALPHISIQTLCT